MISRLPANAANEATRQPWNEPSDPRYARTYRFVGALIILAIAMGTGLVLLVDWLSTLTK